VDVDIVKWVGGVGLGRRFECRHKNRHDTRTFTAAKGLCGQAKRFYRGWKSVQNVIGMVAV